MTKRSQKSKEIKEKYGKRKNRKQLKTSGVNILMDKAGRRSIEIQVEGGVLVTTYLISVVIQFNCSRILIFAGIYLSTFFNLML